MKANFVNTIVDTTPESDALLKEYLDGVNKLTQLVEEMFVKEKQVLLSPVFRNIIVEEGRKVAALHARVHNAVEIDAPRVQ